MYFIEQSSRTPARSPANLSRVLIGFALRPQACRFRDPILGPGDPLHMTASKKLWRPPCFLRLPRAEAVDRQRAKSGRANRILR